MLPSQHILNHSLKNALNTLHPFASLQFCLIHLDVGLAGSLDHDLLPLYAGLHCVAQKIITLSPGSIAHC